MRVSLVLNALFAAVLAVGTFSPVGAQDSEAQTFDMNAAEYYFAPDALNARAGTITINMTNIGPDRPHAFNVRGADGNDVFTSERIQPGESIVLQFSLPEGIYPFYCPVTGHADRGEVGTLFVSAA